MLFEVHEVYFGLVLYLEHVCLFSGENANEQKVNDKKASDEKPVVHIKSKMVIDLALFKVLIR